MTLRSTEEPGNLPPTDSERLAEISKAFEDLLATQARILRLVEEIALGLGVKL